MSTLKVYKHESSAVCVIVTAVSQKIAEQFIRTKLDASGLTNETLDVFEVEYATTQSSLVHLVRYAVLSGVPSYIVDINNTTELDALRSDLQFQLQTPDELDWDYFLETAVKAKYAADKEGRNFTSIESN